jgi:hypothetical protein
MSKQRLTDRLIASSIGLNDLIHIVNTGDTSQNPYGSSYKGTVQQLANAIGGGGGLLVLTTSGSTGPSTYIGNNLNVPIYANSDTFVTGFTYNPTINRLTIERNQSQPDLYQTINSVSGLSFSNLTDGRVVYVGSGGLITDQSGFTYDDLTNTLGVNTIGTSGDCVNDIYVSNIHSCSPLNINPLDEGNVYFGSTSGVTIDVSNNRLTASSISATTYDNLPPSVFSGGTVTGPSNFTNGLTATTISATTYYNLPTDVFVTGGTYTSGNAIFTNNTGGTFNVSGFPIGGGGGQTFYLNLSQPKNGYRFLSTTASTASQQTSGVTINAGLTGTIVSFQTNPLNITLLPGGIWSFYLHSYKSNTNASFNIFVEVYKRTSGGTETLLFATDPTPVTTNSPNPSMQLTDGYFSGTPLTVSDSIVAKVRATNTSNQSHIITLVTEGSQHYSYAVSTIPTQQGLTCDTLSGCSIIQTIQTDISNKYDKSGGTVSGNLTVNGNTSLQSTTATTVTVTSRSGTPSQVASFDTGGKLVAGVGTLGQTTYASYGTSTLTLSNASVGYQLIPGLTQNITVPSNCSVYVFSTGGMQNSNGTNNSFTIDVALHVDGVGPLTNGSFRRITTTNPNTLNSAWTSAIWSMGALLNLTAGNHTIDVRAIYRNTSAGGMSGLVSSDLTLNRQGELYIMIIKN